MIVFTYKDYYKYKNYLTTYLKEDETPYSTSSIKDIHDKLYRDFFYNATEFSLFLKYFLGVSISDDNLINCNNSFITIDYNNRHSDVIYKIKDKPVYLLLEHQSSIDNSINYRILEYYNCILNNTIDKNRLKKKSYKFPIVIPILLYTGNRIWKHTPNIADKQYSLRETYNFKKDKKINFEYEFIDIHNYTIEQLLSYDSIVAYILAIDKCKTKDDLLMILNKICLIASDDTKKQKIKKLITFIFRDFLEDSIKKDLINKLDEREVDTMKYAWDYVREDILREKIQAEKQGEKRGEKNGFINAIKLLITKMLENGESIDKIQLYSGLSLDEIEKIKNDVNPA